MDCEICGKSFPKLNMVSIEGSRLFVCRECEKMGTKVNQPKPSFEEKKPIFKSTGFSPNLDEGLDLAKDFGKRIMQARQRKNLTRTELAKKIFEKESVLQRIESQAYTPSEKVIKKLEKELNISLKEVEQD